MLPNMTFHKSNLFPFTLYLLGHRPCYGIGVPGSWVSGRGGSKSNNWTNIKLGAIQFGVGIGSVARRQNLPDRSALNNVSTENGRERDSMTWQDEIVRDGQHPGNLAARSRPREIPRDWAKGST